MYGPELGLICKKWPSLFKRLRGFRTSMEIMDKTREHSVRTLGSRGGRGGTVGVIVESAGAEAAVALDAVQCRVVAHPDDGLRSTKKIEVIDLGPLRSPIRGVYTYAVLR